MTIKTALSLPKEQFLRIEHLRKAQGLSRSALIQKLIDQWFSIVEERGLVERYIRGYTNKHESANELRAMSEAAAEAFREEGLK